MNFLLRSFLGLIILSITLGFLIFGSFVLIEALKEILTDTNLEFDGENIKVVAMDPSHTVLVVVFD